jgi:hypothetical protein
LACHLQTDGNGGKNPAYDILLKRYSESQLDLLSNTSTSPLGITLLHFDNDANQISVDPWAMALRGALAKTATGIFAEPKHDGNSTESMV